jgi:hemerythrin
MADGLNPENSLELGNAIMDGEHAAQLRLLDSFEKGLREGKDAHDLVIIFDRLLEFTNLHFMSEEVLMQRHAYPALALHAKEHDALLDQARKIQSSFTSDDPTMTESELAILRNWLVEHIQTKDQAFVLYLKKRNEEAC